jgi:rod shape-determining protein MreD
MNTTPNWFFILSTFLLTLVLTLLPMPAWAVWWRPSWVVMNLIFWLMTTPDKTNLGFAFSLGIVLDVLNGTLLGEHAFALTILSYFVLRMHRQLRMFPILQQGLTVGLFVALNQFILFCVQGFIQELPHPWLQWATVLTSMILWPWISLLMRDYTQRYTAVK